MFHLFLDHGPEQVCSNSLKNAAEGDFGTDVCQMHVKKIKKFQTKVVVTVVSVFKNP